MRLTGFVLLILILSACTPGSYQDRISPAQHRQWANELLTIRDFDGAIEEMRLALAGNPNIADALLYADLLEAKGNYKKARKAYKKAQRYPADKNQKQALAYRLGLLETTHFDNLDAGEKRLADLPPVDSRQFDLKSVLLLKKGQLKQALEESQRALAKAENNEQKGWAYFHMAQIYYELRVERDTFGSLFRAINNGRGYSLVAHITEYWDARRLVPFPED